MPYLDNAVTAYLGIGSNLGDREANLQKALQELAQVGTIRRVSSMYESEPVGYRDQPWFINMVCCIDTRMGPFDLLEAIKTIERDMGRIPSFPNAPRIIDIDVLLCGEETIDSPQLTVPHPRMTERAFVLAPLVEIAPELMHPLRGQTFAQLLEELKTLEEIRKWRQGGLP